MELTGLGLFVLSVLVVWIVIDVLKHRDYSDVSVREEQLRKDLMSKDINVLRHYAYDVYNIHPEVYNDMTKEELVETIVSLNRVW